MGEHWAVQLARHWVGWKVGWKVFQWVDLMVVHLVARSAVRLAELRGHLTVDQTAVLSVDL